MAQNEYFVDRESEFCNTMQLIPLWEHEKGKLEGEAGKSYEVVENLITKLSYPMNSRLM